MSLAAENLSSADLSLVFLVLCLLAFGLAIWRATLRDVLGTCLCGGIGLVLLLVAV